MLGLATASQQARLLSQQAQIMTALETLTAAITANTAATQQLVALIPPAATEITWLRNEAAQREPAIAAAAAALVAQQPALDDAIATLTAAVANEPAS